jgi:hypothetical protein
MLGKSCTTNLLSFFEKATAAVDRGESFDAVFLDFAKAFDKVPRKRLLKESEGPWYQRAAAEMDPKLADWQAAACGTWRSVFRLD